MNSRNLSKAGQSALAIALAAMILASSIFASPIFESPILASSAAAQTRRNTARYTDKLIKFNVSEITLESIDFRNQTAMMGIALEISNPLPIKLKDFDYSLRLYGLETIAGNYDGEMKLGGKNGSVINLPVEINLRSIPGVIWTAFKNRGRLKFDLDTAFTLPLFVFEKRFDKSFSGEVPLKSLVDAATLLRASRLGI